VVDEQGKVQGLVAEVNVFNALLKLKSGSNISTLGKMCQGQPIFAHPPHSMATQATKTNQPSLVPA
jgi:hypothetical protein